MATLTQVNTSGCPVHVLDLKHDAFYDFVELQCGPLQANIFRLQLISDIGVSRGGAIGQLPSAENS